MAQATSDLWKSLWRKKNTTIEYAFDVDGTWYESESIIDHSAERELYSEYGIGNATAAKLTLTFIADDVPRGATIKRYARLKNGSDVSEWIQKGVFFANRRTEDDGIWTVEAFDAMRKAETVWTPEQDIVFPLSMPDAVAEFARLMGISVDARTRLNSSYSISYPSDDSTIRQELSYIAAAHAGNFVITDVGELLLVPLISEPKETNNLVTNHGDAITFGGVRIIV